MLFWSHSWLKIKKRETTSSYWILWLFFFNFKFFFLSCILWPHSFKDIYFFHHYWFHGLHFRTNKKQRPMPPMGSLIQIYFILCIFTLHYMFWLPRGKYYISSKWSCIFTILSAYIFFLYFIHGENRRHTTDPGETNIGQATPT